MNNDMDIDMAGPSTVMSDNTISSLSSPERAQGAPVKTPEVDLNERTTVIVGAGAIGLSIARQLATVAKAQKCNHTIIVIDMMEHEFSQFSGHNSGILSSRNTPEELEELGRISKDEWFSLGSRQQFQSVTGYKDAGVYQVLNGGGLLPPDAISQPKIAEWFRGDVEWKYVEDTESFGTVNPKSFGKWLLNETVDLGVIHHFHTFLTGVHRGQTRDIEKVMVRDVKSNTIRSITCHNLIIAAGAWTPATLKNTQALDFVPDLNFSVSSMDFITIENKAKNPDLPTAFEIPMTLLKDKETGLAISDTGLQTIIAHPTSRQIHISTTSIEAQLSGPPTAQPLALANSSHLRYPASAYLHRKYYNPLKQVLSTGHIKTSTHADGLPLIAKAPSSALGDRQALFEHSPRGVFVACGLGTAALSLCLGVAKVVAGMVTGLEVASGVDLEPFALPYYDDMEEDAMVRPGTGVASAVDGAAKALKRMSVANGKAKGKGKGSRKGKGKGKGKADEEEAGAGGGRKRKAASLPVSRADKVRKEGDVDAAEFNASRKSSRIEAMEGQK